MVSRCLKEPQKERDLGERQGHWNLDWNFPSLATKALDTVVQVKEADAVQNELKNDNIIRLGERACVEMWAATRVRQWGAYYSRTYRSHC